MTQIVSRKREIFFHEDDYCQQELLPGESAEYAESELKRINDFAEEHLAPGEFGWTDVYARKEAPIELRAMGISKAKIDLILTEFLPRFDVVFTGYSSHRELCKSIAAWGRSPRCALFAKWNEVGVVQSIWAQFLERDEESISAATDAIASLGKLHRLIYVDWAWGYTCDASDAISFASKLRTKLVAIADNFNESRKA